MEIGKLYKVKDRALSADANFSTQNRASVHKHGWLWMWTGETPPDDNNVYFMRSLATGETKLFFTHEMETGNGDG